MNLALWLEAIVWGGYEKIPPNTRRQIEAAQQVQRCNFCKQVVEDEFLSTYEDGQKCCDFCKETL